MSYDFALWNGDEPLESEEAGLIYAELVERGSSPRMRPTPAIAALLKELMKLYPEPKRGKEDDWPLAAPPDVGPGHIIISVSQSFLMDVWPEIGALTKKYGLTWYNPQDEDEHVQLPTKLSRQRSRLRAKHRAKRDNTTEVMKMAKQTVVGAEQLMPRIAERLASAAKAFGRLRKEYAARKQAAEACVTEWVYSKRSLPDPLPLADETCGWPPGRPMKAKPTSLKNIFVSGRDAAGRVVVERQHTEIRGQYYETFTDWTASPVEVADYDEDEDNDPIGIRFIEFEGGRVIASWGATLEAATYHVYHWDGDRCVRIDFYNAYGKGAKRQSPELESITRASYDKAGELQRVETVASERNPDPEVTFEMRDGKPWWRR